jgi:CheY-like chemotaxis protein
MLADARRRAQGYARTGLSAAATLHGPTILRDRRILVVEDEFILAFYLREMLREAGAVVVGPVGDLGKALPLIEDSLDAAVLDVHLGEDNSLRLADRLAGRHVPFLFQTSDPGFLKGAHERVPVLAKPIQPEQLIETLAGLLHR